MGLDIQEVYWGNAGEGHWGPVSMREALELELDLTPTGGKQEGRIEEEDPQSCSTIRRKSQPGQRL